MHWAGKGGGLGLDAGHRLIGTCLHALGFESVVGMTYVSMGWTSHSRATARTFRHC